jgi:MFS transporter, MHS family, shikimate and dehydroshikimate transport protein
MPSIWKIAIACFVGTAIEWYDFLLYGTAVALVFNRLFFPDFEPALGTLAALATFAAGSLARPLGAAVFGHLGDTRGRKSMLFLTLLCMGLATALIGVLPTYAHVGLLAPVLLVVLRIVQGIGLGGEWGGAVLMAFEHAPATHRGFFASWPQMGAPAGLLLANFVFLATTSALPEAQFMAWGWRIPFLLSLLLVALGLLMRRAVGESPAFTQLENERRTVKQPVVDVLRNYPGAVLLGAGTRAAEAGFITIITTFVLGYAVQTAGIPRSAVLAAVILGTIGTLLLVLISGSLSDRLGRGRMYISGAAFATLAAIPACLLIDSRQVGLLTLGIVVGMLGPGLMFGPQASFLAELFPARVRSSGMSLGFQLGGVLSGALSPVIAAVLVGTSGSLVAVGLYMLALGVVSILSVALARGPAGRENMVAQYALSAGTRS